MNTKSEMSEARIRPSEEFDRYWDVAWYECELEGAVVGPTPETGG